MTGDLFLGGDGKQSIDLPGADIQLDSAFIDTAKSEALFSTLLAETRWEQTEVLVWGKWHKQPRLVAWHGDREASYSYSGSKMAPSPWTPSLQSLRVLVEMATRKRFNSVLLNLYRDQNDRMGWHSDNEPELGESPTIASVSLGAARELLFKHRDNKQKGIHKVLLTNGSLLVMAGDTQRNWLHAINKESTPMSKRINLTFRLVKTQ